MNELWGYRFDPGKIPVTPTFVVVSHLVVILNINSVISFKRGLRYELNVMGNGRCEGSYEESLRVTRASQKLGSCDAMSQMSGSRPASEHNWSIFSVSNFSIHYQRLSCCENPDLKMTPGIRNSGEIKFNLLSLMLRRKIWRATL